MPSGVAEDTVAQPCRTRRVVRSAGLTAADGEGREGADNGARAARWAGTGGAPAGIDEDPVAVGIPATAGTGVTDTDTTEVTRPPARKRPQNRLRDCIHVRSSYLHATPIAGPPSPMRRPR